MDTRQEVIDALREMLEQTGKLRRNLDEQLFSRQLEEQIDRLLWACALCRDRVRQWKEDQDNIIYLQDPMEAIRHMETYLQLQQAIVSKLEEVRRNADWAMDVADRETVLPALLKQLEEQGNILLETAEDYRQLGCEMAEVYAPPEYFFEGNQESFEPPAYRQPYPKNFAEDAAGPEDPFSLPVLPVYAAPPPKDKKENK